jgi:bifunctional DNase/RNase
MKLRSLGLVAGILTVCFGNFGYAGDAVEMKVRGVTMDPERHSPIVVLEGHHGHEAFPIWIGIPEARAIALELEGVDTPRPLTHALLNNILIDLEIGIGRIFINDLRNNTYFAKIDLLRGPETVTIDARPSDAIALAIRAKAPIFVARKVLEATRTVILTEPEPQKDSARMCGISVQNLTPQLARLFNLTSTDGVLVASTDSESSDGSGDVRRGDVIIEADGTIIRTIQDFQDLCRNKESGEEVVLNITRDQRPVELKLLLSSVD